MNRTARQIVHDKRTTEGPPEVPEAADDFMASFKGWYSRGDLPHCDKPGIIQMITYRLGDSMPASRRREWEALLTIEDDREKRIQIEDYLDRGYGECHLTDPQVAALVEGAWQHFDGQRYRLLAWVVMPNHVHLLYEVWLVSMPKLLDSWKGYTSREANKILGRHGAFWQEGFLDTYIRDETHFNRAVRYIESNPVKAGLVRQPEEWPFSSANPKWQWSDGGRFDRYQRAHLVHLNWEQPVGEMQVVLSGAHRAALEGRAPERTLRDAT